MTTNNSGMKRTQTTIAAVLVLAVLLTATPAKADPVSDFFNRGAREVKKSANQVGNSFNRAGRDIKKGFDNAGRDINREFNKLGNEFNKAGKDVEKAFKKAGPELERIGKNAGREIEKGLKDFGGKMEKHVAGPAARAAYNRAKTTVDEFAKEWKDIQTTSKQDVAELQKAIREKNNSKAAEIVLRMIGRSVGLRKMISMLDGHSYGSIIFYAGGGGAYGVGADVAFGNAFDIKSLVELIRTGKLPASRTLTASFVAAGVNVGTSVGGGAEVGVGFDLDAPSEMNGDIAIDVSLDFKLKVGASVTVSLDPKTMSLAGVSVGIGLGGKLELSVGLTYTQVLTELKNDQLNRLFGVKTQAPTTTASQPRRTQQPASVVSSQWRHSGGRFSKYVANGKTYWQEVNAQGKRFTFVEVARTNQNVNIYDATRKVRVLLTPSKSYYLNQNRWMPLYTGSW